VEQNLCQWSYWAIVRDLTPTYGGLLLHAILAAQAYNTHMKHASPTRLRTLVFFVALPLATLSVAQTSAQPAQALTTSTAIAALAAAIGSGRPDQTIQRIRTEDAGSRIDEVRVGGETQSITVQPKSGSGIPPYEVKPSDTARGAAPSSAKNDTTGSRVWNVLTF
jgi:hypothetical protein